MTDEDFDKVDVDEDFADEFDFVDDDHSEGAPASGNPNSSTPGSNKSSSPLIIGVVAAVILLGGGYYAYEHFAHSSNTAKPAPAGKTPLPEPVTTSTTTDTTTTTEPAVSDDQSVSGSEPTTTTTKTTQTTQTTQTQNDQVNFNPDQQRDKLSEALPPPQSKTFEQMQKDLQPAPAKPTVPPEINATLDSISEEMTLNVNQIKQLESTISNLASTVEQLNKTISAMDNRVLGLTETVDGLAQDLTNVKKIMADEDVDLTSSSSVKFTNKKQAQPLKESAADYTVHAIIPGRAWLKSSSGQIITVTEGDKVGDYGTVAVIDAANGLVRTSSGITFK
jgi:archaellum component FlaC